MDSTPELDWILESGPTRNFVQKLPILLGGFHFLQKDLGIFVTPSPLVCEASFDTTSKASQPQVRLHLPTPTSSKFTHNARGLAREIETANHDANNAEFSSIVNDFPVPPNPTRRTQPQIRLLRKYSTHPVHKIFLMFNYPTNEPRDIEVHLLTTMNMIQDKLSHLGRKWHLSSSRENKGSSGSSEGGRDEQWLMREGVERTRTRDTSMSMQEADTSVRDEAAVEQKKGMSTRQEWDSIFLKN
ncbi:hypothetical protein BDP27DRAFT_1430039 [Rhodocollybia butyracea]|uniref:Uncharacterized protein n=1 Tax=Rhodocollybia butyracea TaxID=206335 RepID=A0A9P5P8X8_9AGAR|nr:hypothetical protein BDP27DRAFT_1430039 [Rhodocollybia butyracea]